MLTGWQVTSVRHSANSQGALGAGLGLLPPHTGDLGKLLHPEVPVLIKMSQQEKALHLTLTVYARLTLVIPLQVVTVRLEMAAYR